MADVRELLRTAAPAPTVPLDVDALRTLAAVRPRRRRRLVAWLLGVLGVAGIAVPLRNALAPAGSPDAEQVRTVETVPPEPWRVERLLDLPLEAERLGGVAVWGDRVAYTPDETSVVVVDVPTGATRTVARPTLTNGMFTAIAGHGDWVVFTEISGSTDDDLIPGDAGRFWRVAAVDLRTGRARDIRRGGQSEAYGRLPAPAVDGSWVVWVQEAAESSSSQRILELVVHDLRSWAMRVDRDLEAIDAGIANGTLYVAKRSGDDGTDLFAMAADGTGGLQQLTQAGNVLDAKAAHGWVAWDYQPPSDPMVVLTSFWQLWAQPMHAPGEPVRVGDGDGSRLGDRFLLWSTGNGDIVLRGLDPLGPMVTVLTGIPTPSWQWAARGDRIAWVTDPMDGSQPPTVHVARVLRPGRANGGR